MSVKKIVVIESQQKIKVVSPQARLIRDKSAGAQGATSIGLPPGGTANQFLMKVDGTDYNVTWADVLSSVSSDATLTGDGSAGSPLAVAIPLDASDRTNLDNLSGTNTGDQDLSLYARLDTFQSWTQSQLFEGTERLYLGTNGESSLWRNAINVTYLTLNATGAFKINAGGLDIVTFDGNDLSVQVTGDIAANNLSGTNTGDQDLSGYLQTVSTDLTITGDGTSGSPLSAVPPDLSGYLQTVTSDATIDGAGTGASPLSIGQGVRTTDRPSFAGADFTMPVLMTAGHSIGWGSYSAAIYGDDTANYLRFLTNGTIDLQISDGNLEFGQFSGAGANADKVFVIASGTAPTTQPVDAIQLYSADTNGAIGKAGLHVMTEDGTTHVFGDKVGIGTITPDTSFHVKTGTSGAATTSGFTATIEDNTNAELSLAGGTSGAIYFPDETLYYRGWIQYAHTTDYLSIGVNAVQRMKILSNGDVGIGNNFDPTEKLHVDGNILATGSIIGASLGADYLDLTTGLAAPARQEGRVFYDDERKCIGLYIDETEFTWQVGREFPMRVFNDTAGTLINGRAARVVGVGTGGGTFTLPYIDYATADFSNGVARNTIGIITHDIEPGTFGEVTILGWVNDVDTSAPLVAGEVAWLAASNPADGTLTAIPPSSPDYAMEMGGCLVSDPLVGVLWSDYLPRGNVQDVQKFFNGAILEDHSVDVDSDGVAITLTLDSKPTGATALSMFFDARFYELPVPATLVLTPGTDAVPLLNFVYIPESTKILTTSLTSFPQTGQYVPIATVLCQSILDVQTDQVYKLHAWTDHLATSEEQGHLADLNRWVRLQNASWLEGVANTYTVNGIADTSISTTTAGTILQLHNHNFPIFADPAPFHIINSTPAYGESINLADIVVDSLGGTLLNNTFALILWGAASEHDDQCKLFINLPSGSYNTPASAAADLSKFTNYSIPEEYRGTGFLIHRYICTWDAPGNNFTITPSEGDELRGTFPNAVAGGSAASGDFDPSGTAQGIIDIHEDTAGVGVAGSYAHQEFISKIIANQFAAMGLKGVPAGTDTIIIEDSAAGFAKKRVELSTVGGVGGLDTQIQYNNGGVLGGDAAFTFDDVGKNLGVGGNVFGTDLTNGIVLTIGATPPASFPVDTVQLYVEDVVAGSNALKIANEEGYVQSIGKQFLANSGVVGSPVYSFASDADTGFWLNAVGNVSLSIGGVQTYEYSALRLQLHASTSIAWGAGNAGVGHDVSIGRSAIGKLEVSGALAVTGNVIGHTAINAQTGTTYTLVLTDDAKHVTLSNLADIALTVPPNSSVAFPIGTNITFEQLGAGLVTMIEGAGVTIDTSADSLAFGGLNAFVGITKIGTDLWSAYGDLGSPVYSQAEVDAILPNHNLFINGDFRIDQRNGGGAVVIPSGTAFSVDKFSTTNTASSGGTLTAQQSTLGVKKSLKVTATVATTDDTKALAPIRQIPEAQDIFHLNGKDVTVSFQIETNWTGTLSVSFVNRTADRSYVTDVPVVSGINSVVVTLPFETDTVAANDNGIGIYFQIGATSTGTVQTPTTDAWVSGNKQVSPATTNWANTLNNYINVTDLKIEEGSVATPFVSRPIAEELALCQRYYQKVGIGSSGYISLADTIELAVDTKGLMRADPSVALLTTTPAIRWRNNTANGVGSTIVVSTLRAQGCRLKINGFTGLAIGEGALTTTAALISLDAEL